MIKVGVTGGIGSGKTTFCKALEKLGAFVVYADSFAKELMITDATLIEQIKNVFGDNSYHKDGTLNREFLAKEAFSKDRVDELNALVHPVLWKSIDELAIEKEKDGVELFVKEAALLLQNGRPANLDFVVLLLADQGNRIKRVVQRDKSNTELVQDRISKQQNFEELQHLADFIVTNEGSLDELHYSANALHAQILK